MTREKRLESLLRGVLLEHENPLCLIHTIYAELENPEPTTIRHILEPPE